MVTNCAEGTIPATAGIGLRAEHYRDILEARPKLGWFEVHSENYFGAGGPALAYLERVRGHYPISLHGVGLSLGSTDPLDAVHLARLKQLTERIEPGLVSEHLSWSGVGGSFFNDLIPLPYTDEALDHLVRRVGQVEDFLNRRIVIENPSSYLEFIHSAIPEWEFLAELSRRSGCGILLDVNNVYVSCCNHGWNSRHYLAALPGERVAEIHLAGHTLNRFEDGEILIDTHDGPVSEPVWALYTEALARFGPRPTLIEWDTALPALPLLLAEAERAQSLLEVRHARAA